jgi:hypothetical protein
VSGPEAFVLTGRLQEHRKHPRISAVGSNPRDVFCGSVTKQNIRREISIWKYLNFVIFPRSNIEGSVLSYREINIFKNNIKVTK